MSKFRFINFLDFIFIFLAIFLIFFAWFNFFVRNIILSAFLAVFLSSVIIFIFKYFKNIGYQKNLSNQASQTAILKFKLAIQTYSSQKLISLLKRLVPASVSAVKSGNIYFMQNNKKCVFIPCLQNVDEAQVLSLIKNIIADEIVIFCLDFTGSAESVCSVFKDRNIRLININKFYNILSAKQIEVQTNHIDLSKPKVSVREILKNSLAPQKAKGYFISGLVLLFTSLIIPYKVYYVVFSSLLLLLSILCKFRKRKA